MSGFPNITNKLYESAIATNDNIVGININSSMIPGGGGRTVVSVICFTISTILPFKVASVSGLRTHKFS